MPGPNLDKFMVHAIEHMTSNGVSVHFMAKKRVYKCTGLFCYPSFYVAAGRDNWAEIFVHEYAHFLQHLDEAAGRVVKYPNLSDDDYGRWNDWLNRKEALSKKVIKRLRRGVQKMECDCDRRAVKLIKEFDLEIDLEDYIKRSNAYALFYVIVEKYSQWYVRAPYEIQEVVDIMPSTFLRSIEKLPEGYEQLIVDNCLGRV